jgi:hypothetical protein
MAAAGAPPIARTPLPWPEISVALVVLTTEAISFQYLFPFVPFMVRGFGIREEDVGFYAGWIASAFMVGQFFRYLRERCLDRCCLVSTAAAFSA